MALTGAPTTRDHIANALERNLRKWFLLSSQRFEKTNMYPRLYNVETSDEKITRHTVNAGYGTYVSKPEGQVPTYDSGQEAWAKSYTPQTFALGAEFTEEAIEDDLHGIIKRLAKVGGVLSSVAYYTRERDAMDLFNTYLTSGTVYTAAGTNYPLLSNSHYLVTGSTWDNYLGAMDLAVESLEHALSHWMVNQVNQRGQVMMTQPSVLLVGAADAPMARRLLGTTRGRPQSADNDINYFNDFDIEAIAHPLLTNDGRWLLLSPSDPDYGLTYVDRVKPNVRKWPDADNGNLRMCGRYREAHGATHVTGVLGAD